MLVLSRKTGEVIVIDTPTGRIEIVLVEAGRAHVRLGITAPQDHVIYRAEVAEHYMSPQAGAPARQEKPQ